MLWSSSLSNLSILSNTFDHWDLGSILRLLAVANGIYTDWQKIQQMSMLIPYSDNSPYKLNMISPYYDAVIY